MEAQKFDKLFSAWEKTVDINVRLLACQGKMTEYGKCRIAMDMWKEFDLTEE